MSLSRGYIANRTPVGWHWKLPSNFPWFWTVFHLNYRQISEGKWPICSYESQVWHKLPSWRLEGLPYFKQAEAQSCCKHRRSFLLDLTLSHTSCDLLSQIICLSRDDIEWKEWPWPFHRLMFVSTSGVLSQKLPGILHIHSTRGISCTVSDSPTVWWLLEVSSLGSTKRAVPLQRWATQIVKLPKTQQEGFRLGVMECGWSYLSKSIAGKGDKRRFSVWH